MLATYAKILGNHTADVIRRTSDLTPAEIRICPQPEVLPVCELAVRIDFKGALTDNEQVSGYVMCGSIKKEGSRPLINSIAHHLGLDEGLVDSPEGPLNIISEFLNIVIGLTGADWAEHGFEMRFSTPTDLSGQAPPALTGSEEIYHIIVTTKSNDRVDILAVFR